MNDIDRKIVTNKIGGINDASINQRREFSYMLLHSCFSLIGAMCRGMRRIHKPLLISFLFSIS